MFLLQLQVNLHMKLAIKALAVTLIVTRLVFQAEVKVTLAPEH